MDLFGRFKKLDNSLQRGLDNSFARVFGGKVVPTEIDELLKQHTEESIMSDQDGNPLAPNMFHVEVSTKDLESMLQNRPRLTEDLADRLSRFIRNQGWSTASPVVVEVQAQESLHTGQLKVDALFDSTTHLNYKSEKKLASDNDKEPQHLGDIVDHTKQGDIRPTEVSSPSYPGTEVIAQVSPEPGASGGHGYMGEGKEIKVTLVLQDGSDRCYTLKDGVNIIGRGNGVDLRIPDTGVSRQHAEIMWDGFDAVLTDLNSTNGTSVNNTPVENWLLAHGDVISLGHSEIEVQFS